MFQSPTNVVPILRGKLINMGPDARIRVNLKHGWASYSVQDFQKAIDLYNTEGLDLLLCEDLFDDGKSVLPARANA